MIVKIKKVNGKIKVRDIILAAFVQKGYRDLSSMIEQVEIAVKK